MSALDELRDLAELPPDSRARRLGLDAFFRARMSAFSQRATVVCRQYRLDLDRHHSDVVSIVLEAALTLIGDLLDDARKLETVRSFEAYLSTYIRAAMKSYTGSTAMMAASGMQSVSRRRIRFEKTKADMQQRLGREPTDREVIEEANADARRTRANPGKQGIVLSDADARPVDTADLTAAEALPHEQPAILHPLEGKQMVAEIIERAIAIDPFLGQVASAWIGRFYDDGGHEVVPLREVAVELGVTRTVVHDAIEELRVIGVQIVDEYLETTNAENAT